VAFDDQGSSVSLSSGIVTLWLRGTDDVGCSGGKLPCLRDGLGDDLATSEQREDREPSTSGGKRPECPSPAGDSVPGLLVDVAAQSSGKRRAGCS